VEKKSRRSVGKALLAIAVIAVAILLLMTPSIQGILKDIVSSPFKPRYPEETTFTLERTLTVDANGGTVNSYAIDIPEPMNITQNGVRMQTITSVEYSSDVTREVRYGHNWTIWSNDVPFSGKSSITATYEVTARTVIWDLNEGSSGNVTDIPASLKEQYLTTEWKITPSDPKVITLADEIVGDEENVYVILRSIYDWMRSNIDYPTTLGSGSPQAAVETMESGVGDCDDQAILFASLARAAGVPAWLQLGALYVGIENSWGGHGWVQTYVPLKEGGGEKVIIDTVNGEFLVWRPNRLRGVHQRWGGGTSDRLLLRIQRGSIGLGTQSMLYDSYEALSYVESDRKVSQGSVFELGGQAARYVPGPASYMIPARAAGR